MRGDLLTYEQAGAYLGVSPKTVRHWVQAGRLVRADENPGQGQRALFRPADLEPLRNLWGQLQERRRQKREALLTAGAKHCTRCGEEKPFDAFYLSPCGIGGRASICGACCRQAAYTYIRQPEIRERRRRYKRAYSQTEKHKVYKREYQRRINRAKESPLYAHLRAYHNRRFRILNAVEDGKRSPLCRRHGFALARDVHVARSDCPQHRYRPVRLDQRMPEGWKSVAHFEVIGGRWVCLAPPIRGSETDAQTLRYLVARERGKTFGRPRGTLSVGRPMEKEAVK